MERTRLCLMLRQGRFQKQHTCFYQAKYVQHGHYMSEHDISRYCHKAAI